VTCHSSGVHEFNPTNRTCMAAGCHPDARVQLGRMGSLDIYCTTCHNFNAVTPQLAFDSLGAPLSPKVQQCYACHEMRRQLGEMEFLHDPHKGECGMCHNPHEQQAAADARATCASASCHPPAETLQSPFHVGVPSPEQCTRCHLSHSWKVEGANCTRCHQTILHERGPARAPRSAAPAPAPQHAGAF
jgi:hypothetical protein